MNVNVRIIRKLRKAVTAQINEFTQVHYQITQAHQRLVLMFAW